MNNPNPSSNPPPADPYYSSHYSYYSQNPQLSLPFPHVYTDPPASSSTTDLKPPGVDSYPSVPQPTQPAARSYVQVEPTQPTALSYVQAELTQPTALSYLQANASSSAYYFDPNFQNWVATGVSVAQEGLQQLSVAQPASTDTLWASNYVYQPQGNGNSNKRPKKTKVVKTKVVQSAYCEVCKVDCNSKDVLDNHKLGKKHKKNLEKLLSASAPRVVSNHPIGPQLDPKKATPDNIQRTAKNKATDPPEDLETKRRKIVGSGAAQEAVRVCEICNVVCNSEGVYNFHLAGKKHATMLKKYMGGVSVVAAT